MRTTGDRGSRAEQVVRCLVEERVAQHLGVTGGCEGITHPTTQHLRHRVAAAGRRGRQLGRNKVVADDAGDLFGERPFVGEVWAPGRWSNSQVAGV